MSTVRKTQASGYRNACLKAVFAACKANHIDEDARHDIVKTVTGKTSLKSCSTAEIGRVLDRLNQRQHKAAITLPEAANRSADDWRFVFRAAESRQPYLKKIYRLAETIGQMQTPPVKVMPKHYVEGVAKQMLRGLDTRMEFCGETLLIKIIAALDIHIRRLRPYKGGAARSSCPEIPDNCR